MGSETYKFINFNRVFKSKSRFHCESMSLINVAINSGCFEEYTRETDGQFKERVRIDRKHIRHTEYIFFYNNLRLQKEKQTKYIQQCPDSNIVY